MDARRYWFLARYYASNALRGKVGGRSLAREIRTFESRWNALKEHFSGHDEVLVVGNGPSLTAQDLSELTHVPAIASNKIYLIFEQTSWRPTLYTIADPILVYKLRNHDFGVFHEVACPTYVARVLKSEHTLPWMPMKFEEAVKLEKLKALDISPMTGIFGGHTITVTNIQLALWLGAKRIYLIGCDHSYREPEHDRARVKVRSEASNHFAPGYRARGEIVNNAPIDLMNEAFDFVKTVASRRGIEVINISRRSALTTFPRSSVEEVVKSAGGHGRMARGR